MPIVNWFCYQYVYYVVMDTVISRLQYRYCPALVYYAIAVPLYNYNMMSSEGMVINDNI